MSEIRNRENNIFNVWDQKHIMLHDYVWVWIAFPNPRFQTFFFFFQRVNNNIFTFGKNTVYTLFMHGLYTVYGSHNTIYIFKNYFSIVILVFNFSKNKLYPNRPYIYIFLCIKSGTIFYFLIFYNHTILFLNVYFRESHLFMWRSPYLI